MVCISDRPINKDTILNVYWFFRNHLYNLMIFMSLPKKRETLSNTFGGYIEQMTTCFETYCTLEICKWIFDVVWISEFILSIDSIRSSANMLNHIDQCITRSYNEKIRVVGKCTAIKLISVQCNFILQLGKFSVDHVITDEPYPLWSESPW